MGNRSSEKSTVYLQNAAIGRFSFPPVFMRVAWSQALVQSFVT